MVAAHSISGAKNNQAAENATFHTVLVLAAAATKNKRDDISPCGGMTRYAATPTIPLPCYIPYCSYEKAAGAKAAKIDIISKRMKRQRRGIGRKPPPVSSNQA